MIDNNLRKLLKDESKYEVSDQLLDWILAKSTEHELKKNDVLVSYGKIDSDVYVLKKGVMRYVYFDGDREKTYGFASPGTFMIQYHCFVEAQPAFFQVEACTDSIVLKISKRDIDEMVKTSHEFAQYMLHLSLAQCYSNEYKYAILNGLARDRFMLLLKNRRDITECVQNKVLASYIGITPSYLSFLKRSCK